MTCSESYPGYSCRPSGASGRSNIGPASGCGFAAFFAADGVSLDQCLRNLRGSGATARLLKNVLALSDWKVCSIISCLRQPGYGRYGGNHRRRGREGKYTTPCWELMFHVEEQSYARQPFCTAGMAEPPQESLMAAKRSYDTIHHLNCAITLCFEPTPTFRPKVPP